MSARIECNTPQSNYVASSITWLIPIQSIQMRTTIFHLDGFFFIVCHRLSFINSPLTMTTDTYAIEILKQSHAEKKATKEDFHLKSHNSTPLDWKLLERRHSNQLRCWRFAKKWNRIKILLQMKDTHLMIWLILFHGSYCFVNSTAIRYILLHGRFCRNKKGDEKRFKAKKEELALSKTNYG